MDSFYGVPRQPPKPPTVNAIQRIPAVPEVSVIENSLLPPSRIFNPIITAQSTLHGDKPTNTDTSFCIYKKHVRFKNSCSGSNFVKENVPQTLKTVPDLNGKTFKQIYMANVPDRHLDLSIFEPPRSDIKALETNLDFTQLCNDSVKEKSFDVSCQMCNTNLSSSSEERKLKSIENTCTTSNFRDREPNFFRDRFGTKVPTFNCNDKFMNLPKRTEIYTQTETICDKKCTEVATSSEEPTIRDLFKIIQQQNEQIMLLQRQVNNLKTSIRQPETDSLPHNGPFMRDVHSSPTKKGLFSFDVKATSFEFSFRPQQHKFRKQNEFLEPRIQEIVESDSVTATRSNSLHLDESLDVKNSYVSNVPSIAIEMDEYHSSDEEDEPQIGLSFYKDLMNQVNNALKKAQKQSECQMTCSKKQDVAGQTMKAVKQATLQHLENIGINLSPIQESSEATGNSDSNIDSYNEAEISCAVQQLLMKYLPSDKLAKVINKPKKYPPKLEKKRFKTSNTEYSFATLQYMKKYNLIDSSGKIQDQEKRMPETAPKILNVTALKLQPKLL